MLSRALWSADADRHLDLVVGRIGVGLAAAVGQQRDVQPLPRAGPLEGAPRASGVPTRAHPAPARASVPVSS